MRVLYLGMFGEFSRLPLAALLAAGVDVCGVVVPGRETAVPHPQPIARLRPQKNIASLPVLTPYPALNIIHLAWEHNIPVYALNRPGHPDTLRALGELQPGVAFVVCFSKRIPAALLTLPQYGFLNLHPSLLPDYRGPQPLFWQLRDGVQASGATLHFMDAGLDTGDIALQTPLSLPDGVSGAEADRLYAQTGANMLLTAVDLLAKGTLPRHPQPEGGSYQPSPAPADFQLETTWTARRAFNFMRGTADHGRPYPIRVAGKRVQLTEALSYDADQLLDAAIVKNGREAWIQFTPGVLQARLLH